MAARSGRKKIRWFRLVVLIVLASMILAFGTGATFLYTLLRGMPTLDDLGGFRQDQSTIIYDTNKQEIRSFFSEENRVNVKLDQVPKHVQDAFIAIEDHRFYEHFGVDFRGILRALWVDLTGRGIRQGASTITQQLIRNAYLSQEQTFSRKIKEAIYAIQLERRYTKKEILETYLNQINFRGVYGIQAASKYYFNKDVGKLTLAEGAMLAGIINAPEYYYPYNNPENAAARQNEVLEAMVKWGYINQKQADEAMTRVVNAKEKKFSNITLAAPKVSQVDYTGAFFVDYVRELLLKKYGPEKVYQGGLRVYTTFDPKAQNAFDKAMHDTLDQKFPITKDKPYVQTAAVLIEAKTGYVRAIVGGRSHEVERGINRAVAPYLRQPGSTIKPLAVYSPALEAEDQNPRITPGTVFDDAPFNNKWVDPETGKPGTWPENWNKTFAGLITVRDAVKDSVNVVAVRVMQQIGVDRGIEYAKKFGLPVVEKGSYNDKNLAFALGGMTRGVSVMDMVGAYTAFPNGGKRVEPVVILKVTDPQGNVLEDNSKPKQTQVIKPQTAFLMTSIMKDVVERGTATKAALPDRPVAGKTGTTSDFKDVWFMGFTPDYVAGIWMGYDKGQPLYGIFGSMYPAQIWGTAMKTVVAGTPVNGFPVPDGIVSADIDIKSGLLPGPYTPAETIRKEYFIDGTQPTTQDDVHVMVLVCSHDPTKLHT
ncbi:MAG: PBP1A family penicillin-binding protein, partial [Actinobacteria bacterium]|nr:PBP1A family penicillin-binding protein [Actinomycetota bacterium]